MRDSGEACDPEPDAVRAGETAAFDALFTRYAPRVTGYLLRLTGDRATAEDLAQETFLAAFAGRKSFAGRSRPLAWLLGIAVRRWRDNQRRRRLPEASATEPADTLSGPEERTLAKLTLEDALSRLDEPLRETFLLIAAQGLRYAEAAQVLGEPVGTVKWRVHEATKRLRKLLSEEETNGARESPREPARPGRR